MAGWGRLPIVSPVSKALSDLSLVKPTPIQAQSIPLAVCDGADLIGAAETGSGKTLAFAIPIVQKILKASISSKSSHTCDELTKDLSSLIPSMVDANEKSQPLRKSVNLNKGFQAIIFVPTRELAMQVKDHTVSIAKYTCIKTGLVIGGLSVEKQARIVKKQPEIVVATPGRFWELVSAGVIEESHLGNVRSLVVDEADRMVEQGHFEDLLKITELLNSNQKLHAKRQTFVFSATLTFVHKGPLSAHQKRQSSKPTLQKKLSSICEKLGVKKNRKVINLTRTEMTVETLQEYRIQVSTPEEKDVFLYYLLSMHPGRTLVFTNSINATKRLCSLLSLLRLDVLSLHANMHQRQRLKNVERFSSLLELNAISRILIATDVAARGLDIPNVQRIVHYEVPRTTEAYVHRSGRTARASASGLSVLLVSPHEHALYRKVINALKKPNGLPEFPLEDSVIDDLKRRVHVARKVELAEHRRAKQAQQSNWYKEAAKEAGLILDERLANDIAGDNAAVQKGAGDTKRLKKELNRLLATNLPRTGTTVSAKSMNASSKPSLTTVPPNAFMNQQTTEALDKGRALKRKRKNRRERKRQRVG